MKIQSPSNLQKIGKLLIDAAGAANIEKIVIVGAYFLPDSNKVRFVIEYEASKS